jgi:ABC-type transport system involved in cytochrome c biogenesis permease subunit
MKKHAQWFPGVVVGIAAVYLLFTTIMPHYAKDEMQFGAFASLPAVDGGRVKPVDTVARTNLMIISGKQTFKDLNDKTQPAVKWLLDVLVAGPVLNRGDAPKYKVFRIENDQVLNLLGLSPRPGSFRYAYDEFADRYEILLSEARRADAMDEKQRDLFDNKLLELFKHVSMFLELTGWRGPFLLPPLQEGEDWQSLLDGLRAKEPVAHAYGEMLFAYGRGDTEGFNQRVNDFHKALGKKSPQMMSAASFEVFFNQFAPFYQCAVLYVWVFVLACLSWLGWSQPLNRAAFWLAAMTLVVHTFALIGRMYLQGRPPVTNLYSSAVFIGWGGVILGLFLEWIYRNGIGSVVGAVLGGLTLIIAHYLATSGDTLEMMQAVLDTNFWLATHVTCITLGYTATFVAGFLGILYIVLGVLTPMLRDGDIAQTLTKMTYGVACFATLLSFTGTVLGGIWADQSWGRFWGWDPKENGALIIVLWNALILHARWGGLVKARGLALLAIGGNIVTAWSWFGVNMLSVGLHNYGFMPGHLFWLVFFVVTQLALIGMGSLPLRMWTSFAPKSPTPPTSPTPGPRDRLKPHAMASS